jgi:hypothetical protein
MIVLAAGRRVDEADAAEARFPLKNVDEVAKAVRTRLEVLNADALVCSAACGADLIALKEAQGLRIRQRIVLPFAPARFRRTSVADRPSNSTWDWIAIFDEMIREASESDDLVILHSSDDETAAYAATNQRIIVEAQKLTREHSGRKEADRDSIRAMIIWEGSTRGEDDLTAAFASAARREGIRVEQVNTLQVADEHGG